MVHIKKNEQEGRHKTFDLIPESSPTDIKDSSLTQIVCSHRTVLGLLYTDLNKAKAQSR